MADLVIAIDTETTGLDARADRLVAVGAQLGGQTVILRHPEDREQIQRLLELPARWLAHNAGFDFGFLAHAGYRIPAPERWIDTVLIAHTAGERRLGQLKLRRLQQKLIEADELPAEIVEPEDTLKVWLRAARREAKKADRPRPEIGHAPRELLDPYLQADVVSTIAVARHYGAHINGQHEILKLEHRCLPAVYAAEQRGVPIDLAEADALRARLAAQMVRLREQLFELAGRKFNLNAPRQVEQLLLDRGVDLSALPETPKSGERSMALPNLKRLDDDLARTLIAYREEEIMARYAARLLKHSHGDRLYGGFHLVGTDTGRMTSSRPNLQNMPKHRLDVRYVIAAGEGKTLVACDQSNVELRVLACYAPGGQLEQAFRDGADLHQQTADALGVERELGKKINFAITYGGGVPRIASILDSTRDEAKAVLGRYFAAYPEVADLRRRLERSVRRKGYLTTIGGRRHYFDQPNHMLINRLVSGSCADLFKRAVIELHRAGVPMILLIHDEVVAEVDEDDADLAGALLERELARGARRGGAVIDGLIAEASTARRWSQFKDPDWTPEPARAEQLPLGGMT